MIRPKPLVVSVAEKSLMLPLGQVRRKAFLLQVWLAG